MYRSLTNQGRFKSACHQVTRGNFILVVVLTIISTILTTYILNSLTSSYRRLDDSNPDVTEASITRQLLSNSIQKSGILVNSTEPLQTLAHQNDLDMASGNVRHVWRQPVEEISVESRITPEVSQTLEKEFAGFKQRLANMSKKDLVTLLKMLQERVAKTALLIRKRNTEQQTLAKSSISPSTTVTNNNQPKTEMEGVVIRSAKMNKLMNYLSEIESSIPDLDTRQLDKLSQMNQDKSSLRIVKPSVMDAIMQPILGKQIKSWKDSVESVAPDPGWPQEAEDWPSPTTSKPKNKKKKKKKTITSTTSAPSTTSSPTTTTSTTTSTTTTVAPSLPGLPDSTTATPSSTPASTIEEVWIEEEEEIVRPPPKKRRKKYKKKTSPPPVNPAPSTTVAPVSSSTTTTTSAPTSTTTAVPSSSSTTTTTTTTTPETTTVEDWPEDQPESTTQSGLWPTEDQGQDEKWPQEIPKEKWPQENPKEKWPEEEWLDAVRDQVQNQFNIVYV